MVQFTRWSQQPCGTSQRTTLLGRGVRSTSVRCFKSNSDEPGTKPTTALRLNFKIPYRVNFGQSLGLIGSGDTLGNWDPKRTVQMKWTDGDWWTVELSMSPRSALDLEYKYVVVNSDGNIGLWKPGGNYRVALSLPINGTKVVKKVKVADAWDDSFKKVDLEEAEVPLAGTSVGSGATVSGGNNGSMPSATSPLGQGQQPGARVPQPAPATAGRTASGTPTSGASAPGPSAAAISAPSPAPTPQVPPAPQAAQAPQAPQPQASLTSAAPAGAPSTSPQQPAAAQQAPETPPSQPPPPAPEQADGVKRPQPRAGSPRAPPPSFAAVTSIPMLHPSLLAEQQQLEEGVRNSLEDLQAQMDKHQQLREKTDDPAAVEVLVADRIVAAANNRVVAYNKALKAVQEYNRLPPSGASIAKDPSEKGH